MVLGCFGRLMMREFFRMFVVWCDRIVVGIVLREILCMSLLKFGIFLL